MLSTSTTSTASTTVAPALGIKAASTSRSGAWTTAWKISVLGLGAVSLAGVLALLIGFASGVVAVIAVAASVATGVLGRLAPRPSPSEVLRPTRGEAF